VVTISLSKSGKSKLLGCFCLTLVLFVGVLLFTRFGVFLVFDIAGDLKGTDNFGTNYTDAPIQITHILDNAQEVTLPDHIEQVSGIVTHNGKLVLSTDQAELFVLTQEVDQTVSGGSLFPFTPLLLGQGSIESVTYSDGEFWLAGETGAFVRTNLSGDIIGSHPLPDALTETDITGLAFGNDKTLYITTDGTMAISKVDVLTGDLQRLSLEFQAVSDQPIAEGAFLWSGVAFEGDRLFLVAENYPIIVVADATSGRVLRAIGINGEHEFSDISVSNGQIILPSDHNYFDKRPPLRIYQMTSEEVYDLSLPK